MKQTDRTTINCGTVLSVLGGLLAIVLFSLFSCGITGVPANHVIQTINKGEHVYYKGVTLRGDLDFTRVSGESNVVNVEVTFIDCRFKGNVTAKDTVFKKNVTFTGSIIKETRDPLAGELRGNVNFSGARFMSNANFDRVQFPRPYIGFQNTKFMGNANFNGARFQDFAWFSRAQFTGRATFVGAKFIYAEFRSEFSRGVSFKNAQFKSYADFYGARFTDYADFEGTSFLNGVGFENATLDGQPFHVQVQGVAFLYSSFSPFFPGQP